MPLVASRGGMPVTSDVFLVVFCPPTEPRLITMHQRLRVNGGEIKWTVDILLLIYRGSYMASSMVLGLKGEATGCEFK